MASYVQLGLPLEKPSKQTIVPVIVSPDHNIYVGWMNIAETTFNGTETTLSVPGPSASTLTFDITTVTLPPRPVGDPEYQRVQQFMAVVYDRLPEGYRPYASTTAFVSTNDAQYAMQWLMPVTGQQFRLALGPFITDLTYAMNRSPALAPTPPGPPTASNAGLRWAVTVALNDLLVECAYFDFNWVTLFQAESQAQPLKIETVSNPVGGEFKSTLVAYPVVNPTGSTEFNTVRIMKLKPVAAGDYVFNFKITDQLGQSVPVVFTLTVV